MEHLQDAHLNEPANTWTPWQADEELYWLIMSNQITPPVWEDAPEIKTYAHSKAA